MDLRGLISDRRMGLQQETPLQVADIMPRRQVWRFWIPHYCRMKRQDKAQSNRLGGSFFRPINGLGRGMIVHAYMLRTSVR